MKQNKYENPSHKTYDDLFGDDFEVVYEEDFPPISFDHSDTEQNESLDDWQEDDRQHQSSRKPKRRSSIGSPVKKTVQAGTKAVSCIIRLLCKIASLFILAVIIYILATHFLEGLMRYGNPTSAVSEKNYAMAAYAGFSVFVLLFEILSFFWSLSGPRVSSKNGKSRRTDTGRGMSAFILTGAGSCLAHIAGGLIPVSLPPLSGLKGAVEIWGNLYPVLLPLCIAGIISCILRRISTHFYR